MINISTIVLSSYLLNACTTTSTSRPPPIHTNSSPPSVTTTQFTRIKHLSAGLQKAFSVPMHTANRLSPIIIQSADRHGISPFLIAAMIQQESSYRSSVVSSAGAVGLTQVMPQYWQNKCNGDLYNEHINIQCGSFILSKYNEQAGNWSKALAYYNVGPYGYQSNSRMRQQGLKYAKSVEQHHKNLINALNAKPAVVNEIQNPQIYFYNKSIAQ